jgi:hypothetical protein
MAEGGGTARRAAPSFGTRGASKWRGEVMLCQPLRTMNIHRVQPEGRTNPGSGFRKPPGT